MNSIAAELLVLRKRASTWILMGVWVLLGIMFAYLLPYLTYDERVDFAYFYAGASLAYHGDAAERCHAAAIRVGYFETGEIPARPIVDRKEEAVWAGGLRHRLAEMQTDTPV